MSTNAEDKTGFEEFYDNPEFQQTVDALAAENNVTAPPASTGRNRTGLLVKTFIGLGLIGALTQACNKNKTNFTTPTGRIDTVYVPITDTVATHDTVELHYPVYIYPGNDTVANPAIGQYTSGHHFIEFLGDPTGHPGLLPKLDGFQTAVVMPGLVLPTDVPTSGSAFFNISGMDDGNFFLQGLRNSLAAIPGGHPYVGGANPVIFGNVKLYDLTNPDVRAVLLSHANSLGDSYARGNFLGFIENTIAYANANPTTSLPLLQGLKTLMQDIRAHTQAIGKSTILSGATAESQVAGFNTQQVLGHISNELSYNAPYPITASDSAFYVSRLKDIVGPSGANGFITAYTNYIGADDTAEVRSAAHAQNRINQKVFDETNKTVITFAAGASTTNTLYNTTDVDMNDLLGNGLLKTGNKGAGSGKRYTQEIMELNPQNRKFRHTETVPSVVPYPGAKMPEGVKNIGTHSFEAPKPSPQDIAAGQEAAKELMRQTAAYEGVLDTRRKEMGAAKSS
jgi:hypothetical protein